MPINRCSQNCVDCVATIMETSQMILRYQVVKWFRRQLSLEMVGSSNRRMIVCALPKVLKILAMELGVITTIQQTTLAALSWVPHLSQHMAALTHSLITGLVWKTRAPV